MLFIIESVRRFVRLQTNWLSHCCSNSCAILPHPKHVHHIPTYHHLPTWLKIFDYFRSVVKFIYLTLIKVKSIVFSIRVIIIMTRYLPVNSIACSKSAFSKILVSCSKILSFFFMLMPLRFIKTPKKNTKKKNFLYLWVNLTLNPYYNINVIVLTIRWWWVGRSFYHYLGRTKSCFILLLCSKMSI